MRWLELLNTVGLLCVAVMAYLNNKAVKEVHVLINSRLSQLLELTRISSKAEGVLEGREAPKENGK